jgi:uncharacterized protein (UPF0332 family)
MNIDARLRLELAERFLGELADLEPGRFVGACIHAGYYARFHAAAAVILAAGDDAPKTHSGVIARFSQLLRSRQDDRPDAIKLSGRAFETRLLADYDAEAKGLPDKARDLKVDAPKFVAFCRSLISGDQGGSQ